MIAYTNTYFAVPDGCSTISHDQVATGSILAATIDRQALLLTARPMPHAGSYHFRCRPASVIDPSIPDAIVHGVLKPLGAVRVEPVALGMSGGRVFRCELDTDETLALKEWPDGTPRSRVQEVHKVMQHVVDRGCSLVPRLQSIILAGGRSDTVLSTGSRHWEISDWMPGAPIPSNASPDLIRRGAQAIAKFHASARDLGAQPQSPPAARARLRRLRQLDAMLPRAIEFAGEQVESTDLRVAISDACRLVQLKWDEVRQQITRSLSQYGTVSVNTQHVLRDVHRLHVLFHEGEPTALIDFDAIRVDCVATDLARWAGSFLGGEVDSESVWDAAVAGFRDEQSFKDETEAETEAQLAKHLCYAGTWISLANWLVWLWQRREFPAGPVEVSRRIRELMGQADLA